MNTNGLVPVRSDEQVAITIESHAQLFAPTRFCPEDPIAVSRGFIKVANTIVDRMPEMGVEAWAVYCQLVRHADRQGHCFPSVRRLADLCVRRKR